jgi:alpha-beta hydrolase superfamily lysophospholipase
MAEQVVGIPSAVASAFELTSITSEVDGFRLQAYHWPAARALEGVVVLAHGAAEHAGRYARFAEALAEQGFEIWALDHRGHGRSPGPNGLGEIGRGGWDALVADIAQLVRAARETKPDAPLALIGHSMGAFAAQHFCTEFSTLIDAVVLSGTTAFDFADDARELPALDFNAAFAPVRTGYDWLSRDAAEVDKYIADPLCGFEVVLPVFSVDDLRRLSAAKALANIRAELPMLLVAGEMDPLNARLAGARRLEQKFRAAGVQQVDSRYYEGGRHEMLNEINRDEVTRDIVDWLKTVLRSEAVRHSYIRYSGSRTQVKPG